MEYSFGRQVPFTHGIEIEQDGEDVRGTAAYRAMDWHRDGSGPQETDLGPQKFTKSLLNDFYANTRNVMSTWEWRNATRNGSGCGSHVHFHFTDVEGCSHEDTVEAWTITYNTLVELTPIFAPFWCHDWQNGFRSSVSQWAGSQTRRYSHDSMERAIRTHSGRSYNAVTLNAGYDKPLTAELRLNEGHPAIALAGTTFLRNIIRRCLKEGWSPKFQDHNDTLRRIYRAIYARGNLFMNLDDTGPIAFEPGRGVPGVNREEFESALDLLDAILKSISTDRGVWSHRAMQLVRSFDARNSPSEQGDALWMIDVPRGVFSWETMPADATE